MNKPGKSRKLTEMGGATLYHHGDEIETNSYQRVSIVPGRFMCTSKSELPSISIAIVGINLNCSCGNGSHGYYRHFHSFVFSLCNMHTLEI